MSRLQSFILKSIFLLSCSDTNNKKKPEIGIDKTNSYSFTIDLVSLKSQSLLNNSQIVKVEFS